MSPPTASMDIPRSPAPPACDWCYWQFELIAATFAAVRGGRIRRLIVSVPLGLGRLSGLVPGPRLERADPVHQLCPGPRRQALARLPAIADEDERHWVETAFGRQGFGRRAGRACIPSASRSQCSSRSAAPRASTPRTLRSGGRRPIPTDGLATRQRRGQGGVVQEVRAERAARPVRPRRAELGHRQ
jgi:hypothetical protein